MVLGPMSHQTGAACVVEELLPKPSVLSSIIFSAKMAVQPNLTKTAAKQQPQNPACQYDIVSISKSACALRCMGKENIFTYYTYRYILLPLESYSLSLFSGSYYTKTSSVIAINSMLGA